MPPLGIRASTASSPSRWTTERRESSLVNTAESHDRLALAQCTQEVVRKAIGFVSPLPHHTSEPPDKPSLSESRGAFRPPIVHETASTRYNSAPLIPKPTLAKSR